MNKAAPKRGSRPAPSPTHDPALDQIAALGPFLNEIEVALLAKRRGLTLSPFIVRNDGLKGTIRFVKVGRARVTTQREAETYLKAYAERAKRPKGWETTLANRTSIYADA